MTRSAKQFQKNKAPIKAVEFTGRATLPMSTTLPEAVRQSLAAAALVDPETPVGESHVRASALDYVIRKARTKYPQFFQSRQ